MFEGPMEDRLAIRERIDAYGGAVMRHDAEAWIACWHEDGVWRLPGIDVTGKAQIKAAWTQAMTAFAVAGFFAFPGEIRVDGDRASARVFTQEILVGRDGSVRRILGAYRDDLVRTGGAWLFARREYTILHDEAEQ